METRKVQEVGGGTYTVSLPKEWADAQGLGAGSVVDLHTHIDDLLVVHPPDRGDDTARRALVHVDHDDTDCLERTLRAAYAAGVAEVLFVAGGSFTREQRRRVNRVVGTLVGVAMDEESESRLLIRTLLDPEEVSVWQSVRQLQFLALSMHREALAALVGDAPAENTRSRDDEADRLFAMIDRHFSRGLARLDEVDALGVTRSELFEVRSVARELERVADHAERLATAARHLDTPPVASTTEELRALGELAQSVVEDASRCVIDDGDVETAYDVLTRRGDVTADIDALESRLFENDRQNPHLVRALYCLRRTAEIGGNIAELRLRMAAQRGELNDHSVELEIEAQGARDDGE